MLDGTVNPQGEQANTTAQVVEKTLPEQIAISIRAALDPMVKQFDELRNLQSDFAKKTNAELMRNRLRASGKEVPSDGDAPNVQGTDNAGLYESFEERMELMASLPKEFRETVREELRGLSPDVQLKTLKLLAKRDAMTPAAAATPAAPAPQLSGRGGAPLGASSQSVAHPRSQHAFFRMSKEARAALSRDPGFDPSELPRIVPEDVNGG